MKQGVHITILASSISYENDPCVPVQWCHGTLMLLQLFGTSLGCAWHKDSCVPQPGWHWVWSKENEVSWAWVKREANAARVRKCQMSTRAYRIRDRVTVWGGRRERQISQAALESLLAIKLSDARVGLSKCWGFVDLSHYMKQFILVWASNSCNVQGAMSPRVGGWDVQCLLQ